MKTITDATVFNAFKKVSEKATSKEIKQQIVKATNETKIHTGELIKFYPWIDKGKVRVDGKIRTCRMLHRCGGNILDLFTPIGTESFDDDLKERVVTPFAPLPCLIADIKGKTDEWLLLGFYIRDELIATTPADVGDYKISRVDALETQDFNMRTDGEWYTKSEVDTLLNDLKNEILEEIMNDNSQSQL